MKRPRLSTLFGVLSASLVLFGLSAQRTVAREASPDPRPNIVVILADDLGFSDLGCYGSEIETPNLDRLAAHGLKFTQFYNCAKCETTRATLMSGRYHPEVGVGQLRNCVTIAEALKLAGYTTLMTGKWHLSKSPTERGFDHYFGHLSGATNYFWGDDTFRLDGQPYQVPREGFYTTDANTDWAIRFLKQRDPSKPFFLYVAYNAPHYPLQAPKEDVEKYRGRYRVGWDVIRQRRYERQKELKLLPRTFELPPRPDDVPAWDSLTDQQKDRQDLVMATYAGMIDHLDRCVGRLVQALDSLGVLDNTLILFLSDNGACPFQRTKPETLSKHLMPWQPESYWTYDKGWAHVCNTPFREYKRNQHEGGISTPLIAYWPKGIRNPGRVTNQVGHLVDIMATCLDLAGVEYPTTYHGQPVGPPRGLSLRPIFEGKQRPPHDYLFFTFYGEHNALRIGDWKLVNKNFRPWELYNMAEDRTELHNLADSQPERLEQMARQWKELADQFGVKPRKRGRGRHRGRSKGKSAASSRK